MNGPRPSSLPPVQHGRGPLCGLCGRDRHGRLPAAAAAAAAGLSSSIKRSQLGVIPNGSAAPNSTASSPSAAAAAVAAAGDHSGGTAVVAATAAASADRETGGKRKRYRGVERGGGSWEKAEEAGAAEDEEGLGRGVWMRTNEEWLGPLLGPLSERMGAVSAWVHRECAVWSPEVFFSSSNRLKNVCAAIRRGRQLRCSRCARAGATLGCKKERCPNSYHVPCARFLNCHFDEDAYLISCPDHSPASTRVSLPSIPSPLLQRSNSPHLLFPPPRPPPSPACQLPRAALQGAVEQDTTAAGARGRGEGGGVGGGDVGSSRKGLVNSRSQPLQQNERLHHHNDEQQQSWQQPQHGKRRFGSIRESRLRKLRRWGGTPGAAAAAAAAEKDEGEEEEAAEAAAEEEEWAAKERRRLARDIARIGMVWLGGGDKGGRRGEEGRGGGNKEKENRGEGGRGAVALMGDKKQSGGAAEDLSGFQERERSQADGDEEEGNHERRQMGEAGGKAERLGAEQWEAAGSSQGTGWSSVGGLESSIQCLKEMVILPLLYPSLYPSLAIDPPKGVILHGPPGCGKTHLVRALAAEMNRGKQRVAFFSRKGADCLGKYVGDAERHLRLLFQMAVDSQPSVIFFDEIDGLTPARGTSDPTHASVVATLLALMDGLHSRGSVIVLAATNRLETIDPSLRRPGRFDRELYVPLPSLSSRAAILSIRTRSWPSPPQSSSTLLSVARCCRGFSAADLSLLCSQAAMNALKRSMPQNFSSLLSDITAGRGARKDESSLCIGSKIGGDGKDCDLDVNNAAGGGGCGGRAGGFDTSVPSTVPAGKQQQLPALPEIHVEARDWWKARRQIAVSSSERCAAAEVSGVNMAPLPAWRSSDASAAATATSANATAPSTRAVSDDGGHTSADCLSPALAAILLRVSQVAPRILSEQAWQFCCEERWGNGGGGGTGGASVQERGLEKVGEGFVGRFGEEGEEGTVVVNGHSIGGKETEQGGSGKGCGKEAEGQIGKEALWERLEAFGLVQGRGSGIREGARCEGGERRAGKEPGSGHLRYERQERADGRRDRGAEYGSLEEMGAGSHVMQGLMHGPFRLLLCGEGDCGQEELVSAVLHATSAEGADVANINLARMMVEGEGEAVAGLVRCLGHISPSMRFLLLPRIDLWCSHSSLPLPPSDDDVSTRGSSDRSSTRRRGSSRCSEGDEGEEEVEEGGGGMGRGRQSLKGRVCERGGDCGVEGGQVKEGDSSKGMRREEGEDVEEQSEKSEGGEEEEQDGGEESGEGEAEQVQESSAWKLLSHFLRELPSASALSVVATSHVPLASLPLAVRCLFPSLCPPSPPLVPLPSVIASGSQAPLPALSSPATTTAFIVTDSSSHRGRDLAQGRRQPPAAAAAAAAGPASSAAHFASSVNDAFMAVELKQRLVRWRAGELQHDPVGSPRRGKKQHELRLVDDLEVAGADQSLLREKKPGDAQEGVGMVGGKEAWEKVDKQKPRDVQCLGIEKPDIEDPKRKLEVGTHTGRDKDTLHQVPPNADVSGKLARKRASLALYGLMLLYHPSLANLRALSAHQAHGLELAVHLARNANHKAGKGCEKTKAGQGIERPACHDHVLGGQKESRIGGLPSTGFHIVGIEGIDQRNILHGLDVENGPTVFVKGLVAIGVLFCQSECLQGRSVSEEVKRTFDGMRDSVKKKMFLAWRSHNFVDLMQHTKLLYQLGFLEDSMADWLFEVNC